MKYLFVALILVGFNPLISSQTESKPAIADSNAKDSIGFITYNIKILIP
ncbi:MAG: hypothetical protein IPI60_13795 [Saprospiraceae bacterium]|nr:hypothetical protein [Saprospiraceae bacterium]